MKAETETEPRRSKENIAKEGAGKLKEKRQGEGVVSFLICCSMAAHESESALGASSQGDDETTDLLSGKRSGRRLQFRNPDDDVDDSELVVSGRAKAEVLIPRRRSFLSRHRGPLAVVIALVIAASIGVIIYFAVNTARKEADLPTAQPVATTQGPVATCTDVPAPERRVDCFPETNTSATEATCLARGCCWDESAPAKGDGVIGQPACYYPRYYGYRTSRIENIPGVPSGIRMVIDNDGAKFPSPYPGTVETLHVEIDQQTENRVRIKVRSCPHGVFLLDAEA